jgi:hypothetical protein
MGKWYIMLPDILVFFSIFGFGFLAGVFLVLFIVAYNIMNGTTLTIRKEEC